MNNTYINPTNFATRINQRGFPNARMGQLDFDAFVGHGSFGKLSRAGTTAEARNVSRLMRNGALGSARMLGGIGRLSQPLSRTFNMGVRSMTYGRAGMVGGLGLLAVRNGANMMDRMRYGDYGGAMVSGALTAAAGYGAYSSFMYKGAMRSHFNNAAAWLLKKFR